MITLTDSGRAEAGSLFRALPRRLGCAQSVVELAGREDLSAGMASCGGGRAPEGLCGALWGALQAVSPESRAALRAEFEESLGYVTCRDLKQSGKVPCLDCVAMGLALARKYGVAHA